MSSGSEQNGSDHSQKPKSVLSRPIGGVSIFGGNPGLLGDLKSRLKKTNPSEEERVDPQSSQNTPDIPSPSTQNSVIEESLVSPTGGNSKTSSTPNSESTDGLLPNLTRHRARKPQTRRPTFRHSTLVVPLETDLVNSSTKIGTDWDELNRFFGPLNSEGNRVSLSPKPRVVSVALPTVPGVSRPKPKKSESESETESQSETESDSSDSEPQMMAPNSTLAKSDKNTPESSEGDTGVPSQELSKLEAASPVAEPQDKVGVEPSSESSGIELEAPVNSSLDAISISSKSPSVGISESNKELTTKEVTGTEIYGSKLDSTTSPTVKTPLATETKSASSASAASVPSAKPSAPTFLSPESTKTRSSFAASISESTIKYEGSPEAITPEKTDEVLPLTTLRSRSVLSATEEKTTETKDPVDSSSKRPPLTPSETPKPECSPKIASSGKPLPSDLEPDIRPTGPPIRNFVGLYPTLPDFVTRSPATIKPNPISAASEGSGTPPTATLVTEPRPTDSATEAPLANSQSTTSSSSSSYSSSSSSESSPPTPEKPIPPPRPSKPPKPKNLLEKLKDLPTYPEPRLCDYVNASRVNSNSKVEILKVKEHLLEELETVYYDPLLQNDDK
ncbi:unnamed protein product [Echinostoma caproni]|uniref:Flocculation protein FLO11-like n=1 Tax=Echinostoma caproni TaxID=27848 RepID=A0A183A4X8_9TREM|nr:unnamed protein product [Echinostoma caproni]